MRHLIAGLVLAGFASQANAVCKQVDMAGNWQWYYDEYFCTLSVANDGKVKGGNCTLQREPGTNDNRVYPVTGRFTMKSNCRVAGTLTLAAANPFGDPEPFRLKITQSRTRKDTQHWSGALWNTRQDEAGPFNAVRIGRHN